MKKPTKKELIDMLGKISLRLQEHQHEDKQILKGYSLDVNIGMTDITNDITRILSRNSPMK